MQVLQIWRLPQSVRMRSLPHAMNEGSLVLCAVLDGGTGFLKVGYAAQVYAQLLV